MLTPLNATAIGADVGLLVLIWLVQLVIYPTLHEIMHDRFIRWHAQYTIRISVVVLPLMLVQLLASVGLLWNDVNAKTIGHLLLVLIAWGVTFILAVPCHRRLATYGKDRIYINRLIYVNWIRTVVWSACPVISVTSVVY